MKKITFAILSIILFSCQEKLPKPTETGNNTFGCKINGKSWIPDGDGAFISPQKPISGGFYVLTTNSLTSIYIYTVNREQEGVEFFVKNENIGTYELNKDTGIIPRALNPENYGLVRKNSKTFVTSSKYTGKIIITKSERLTTGILSGTFEFTAGAGTETVKVTKGVFDVNVKTLK